MNTIFLNAELLEIHCVSKKGNVVVSTPDISKFLISGKNFNKIMNSAEIEGVIVEEPEFELPLFKTFQF